MSKRKAVVEFLVDVMRPGFGDTESVYSAISSLDGDDALLASRAMIVIGCVLDGCQAKHVESLLNTKYSAGNTPPVNGILTVTEVLAACIRNPALLDEGGFDTIAFIPATTGHPQVEFRNRFPVYDPECDSTIRHYPSTFPLGVPHYFGVEQWLDSQPIANQTLEIDSRMLFEAKRLTEAIPT